MGNLSLENLLTNYNPALLENVAMHFLHLVEQIFCQLLRVLIILHCKFTF
jgi:hypothetical protein